MIYYLSHSVAFEKNAQHNMLSLTLLIAFNSIWIRNLFPVVFDTVKHSILLQKLEHYDIRGVVKNWFYSYLNDRYQTIPR